MNEYQCLLWFWEISWGHVYSFWSYVLLSHVFGQLNIFTNFSWFMQPVKKIAELSMFMGSSTRLLFSLERRLFCYHFNLSLRQHICGFAPTTKEFSSIQWKWIERSSCWKKSVNVVPTETSTHLPQVFGQEMFDVGSHCSQQDTDWHVVSNWDIKSVFCLSMSISLN